MWQVLKAELAYVRPWLLGALGIASAVLVLMTLVFAYGTDGSTDPWVESGIRAMFLLMAPLIVTFIMQAYRSEERRLRLLMAGPVTPRQVVIVSVLLTLALLGVGVGLSVALTLVEAAISGAFEIRSIHLPAMVGGVMFAAGQMVALAQESVAAHNQGRRTAARLGWGRLRPRRAGLHGIAGAVDHDPDAAELAHPARHQWRDCRGRDGAERAHVRATNRLHSLKPSARLSRARQTRKNPRISGPHRRGASRDPLENTPQVINKRNSP